MFTALVNGGDECLHKTIHGFNYEKERNQRRQEEEVEKESKNETK